MFAPLQFQTTCNDYDDDLLFGRFEYKFSCLYLEISVFVCMRVFDMFNNYDHILSMTWHKIQVPQLLLLNVNFGTWLYKVWTQNLLSGWYQEIYELQSLNPFRGILHNAKASQCAYSNVTIFWVAERLQLYYWHINEFRI